MAMISKLTKMMVPCHFSDTQIFPMNGYDAYREKMVYYHTSTCDGNCGR